MKEVSQSPSAHKYMPLGVSEQAYLTLEELRGDSVEMLRFTHASHRGPF